MSSQTAGTFDKDLETVSRSVDIVLNDVEILRTQLTDLKEKYIKTGLKSLFSMLGEPKEMSVSELLRTVRAIKDIRSL